MLSTLLQAAMTTVNLLFLAFIIFLVVAYFKRNYLKQKIKKEGFTKSDRFKGMNNTYLWFDDLTSRVAFMNEFNNILVFHSGKIDYVKVYVNGQEISSYQTMEVIKDISLTFKIPQKERSYEVDFLHSIGKEVKFNSKKNNQVLEQAFEWKKRLTQEKQIAVK